MNDLMLVVLIGVAILLIWAAVKDKNPVDEVKSALQRKR